MHVPKKIKNTHTSWKEGTNHEAEVDCGHGEEEQEDKDKAGVTVAQHRSIRAHLQQQNKKFPLVFWFDIFIYSEYYCI